MATQRYISTSFWDDDWIQTLDPSEKLLFLYYMTCPLTNISGVYKISPRRVSFDTGFTPDTVGHIMQKFQKAHKVYRYEEYIVIPSWPSHQKWEVAPRIRDGIVANLLVMSEDVLQFLVKIRYKFDLKSVFDTLSIPYPNPSSYSDSDSDLDLDTDTEFEINEPSSVPDANPKQTSKNSSSAKAADPLYHPIEQSFLSQGRFTNYKKEGALINVIIKGIRNLDPDDPESAARKILETFRTLTAGNERFWREQPFTPSGLSPNLARVWAIVQKSEPRQEDWFENLQGGGSVSEPIPFR